jgi:uncharacterized protein
VLLGDAEAVKQRAKRAAPRSGGGGGFAVLILVALILVALTMGWAQSQQTAHPGRAVRRSRDPRRREAARQASDWGSSASGWGGWSGGSGSGSGGGFSGGGGDFGGGGSSGSW